MAPKGDLKMETKMTYKLKPCPFCGGQAITQEMRYSMLQSENFVKCVNCGAESSRYYDDIHSAIKAWNRRVNDNSRKCCICGRRINGYGNNPAPVKDEGVCCDRCNNTIVLAARIKALKDSKL